LKIQNFICSFVPGKLAENINNLRPFLVEVRWQIGNGANCSQNGGANKASVAGARFG
jgi:hypothetical protein